MGASRKRFPLTGGGLAATLVILSVLGCSVTSNSAIASASSAMKICAASQLAVAVESANGGYAAAGNEGVPFVIVNISRSTCALDGYPRLTTSPTAFKKNKVKVVDGGGMIFVAVRPRVVIIRPGATASFGLDYVDAADQQDPNGGPCLTKHMTVFLPTRSHPFTQPFTTIVNINFCYSGFRFDITSIQSGPIAKVA